MKPIQPTLYPEVNIVLDVLVPEVQAILGDQFVGMYLYGSLAYGGFDVDSDVDYVVVTCKPHKKIFREVINNVMCIRIPINMKKTLGSYDISGINNSDFIFYTIKIVYALKS